MNYILHGKEIKGTKDFQAIIEVHFMVKRIQLVQMGNMLDVQMDLMFAIQ